MPTTSKSKNRKSSAPKPAPAPVSAFGRWLWASPLRLAAVILMSLAALLLPGRPSSNRPAFPVSSPAIREIPYAPEWPRPPIPILADTVPLPPLSALGLIITDESSGAVLAAIQPDTRLMPASTTKIMTALVALDLYRPDEVLTVTNANESLGSKAELQPGEKYSLEDFLYALLVSSGNDAAVTLAQNDPQGYSGFIDRMNQKAQALHLTQTHFTNASGIENDAHYTTPRDLAILTREALKHPLFKAIVNTRTKTIRDRRGYSSHLLHTTNLLLGTIPGVAGVKTGWTEQSGECLVTYVNRDNHPIIIVLLDSQDRFGETKALIDWVYRHYRWVPFGDVVGTLRSDRDRSAGEGSAGTF